MLASTPLVAQENGRNTLVLATEFRRNWLCILFNNHDLLLEGVCFNKKITI